MSDKCPKCSAGSGVYPGAYSCGRRKDQVIPQTLNLELCNARQLARELEQECERLREDKARLDWLIEAMKDPPFCDALPSSVVTALYQGNGLREAISLAMKNR